MTDSPRDRLLWQGSASIDRCAELLRAGRTVELQLPSNFNHALFAELHGDVPTPQAERLDVAGGPDLLSRIARIDGLESLQGLQPSARDSAAEVRIVSPARLVIGPDARRTPSPGLRP